MEDADSDSGFDSDGNRYYAGRNVMYGTRTDSTAVGQTDTKAHKGRVLSRALMSRSYDAAVIRQDMKNRFSPEKIAKQYCCLYGELSKRMELG